jgi:hypothetical protein
LIANLAILLLLALIGSACQSAVTASPTPPAVASQPPPPPVEVYPQPYPLETFNPYLPPTDPYPSAYPAVATPLVPLPGAGLYPAVQDGAEVMWPQAAAMILNQEVAQVMQTHDLKVYLTLKDGRTLLAFEPEIDEVLRIIEFCGDPCKKILIATE